MNEIGNNSQAGNATEGLSLKPYQQPKLTPLGSIHSLVRANPGAGLDASGHPTNSAS